MTPCESYFFYMIKKLTLLILIVSFPLNLYSKELRHFNPDIFGKSVDEKVTLLLPSENKEAIMPIEILTDVDTKKDIYVVAVVHYPYDLTFEEARLSLNKLYKKYEVEFFKNNSSTGVWRNTDKGYSIQMVIHFDGIEQVIHVNYISYKHVINNQGGETK